MYSPTPSRQRGGLPLLEIGGSILVLGATILLVTQLSTFSSNRQTLPHGLEIGGVPVGGLSRPEAQAYLEQVYGNPVTVFYDDQEIQLDPDQIGFQLNSDVMLSQADETQTEGSFWSGFWDYLWRRPEEAFNIELSADYSPEQLEAWLQDVASRYNKPVSSGMAAGTQGYELNIETATMLINDALRKPVNRTVVLPINTHEAEKPGIEVLQSALTDYLISTEFQGVVSAYIVDMQTGEEIDLNIDMRQTGSPQLLDCTIAYASTSTMKIPIMTEYFRYLIGLPLPFEYEKIEITMIQSGNWSANSMLLDIGFEDQSRGVETVTNSMQYLGLQNTFIVGPYDEEEDPVYYSTPAREAARNGDCINTRPDPYMQTTTRDLAVLLDMIYQCAEFNGGGLVATYNGQIEQTDCEMMLEIMARNEEGQLIMAGVPEDVAVAHKHGWTTDTHGDAGVVFSPGGDYVITIFVWADIDWLPATISFPVIMGVSETVFNYFNPTMVDVPRRGLNLEF